MPLNRIAAATPGRRLPAAHEARTGEDPLKELDALIKLTLGELEPPVNSGSIEPTDTGARDLIALCKHIQGSIRPLLDGETSDGTPAGAVKVDLRKFSEAQLNLLTGDFGALLADLAVQGKVKYVRLTGGVHPQWVNHDQFHVRYDKSRPYYSTKQDGRLPPDVNFNFQTTFHDALFKDIVCRHLALSMFHQWEKFDGKAQYADYASKAAIRNSHSKALEYDYENLRFHDSDVYAVNNRIGIFFKAQFASMVGGRETRRQMVMSTGTHAMAFQLKIKERKDGFPTYVVKVYDPNHTATHARVALKSLDKVARLDIKDFVEDPARRFRYRIGDESEFGFVHLKRSQARPHATQTPRRLTAYEGAPDPTVHKKMLNRFMSQNLPGSFAESVHKMAPDCKGNVELVELLAARDADGFSGLYDALASGHAEAIKAYGELLAEFSEVLSQRDLASLLAAKHPSFGGFSGVYLARSRKKSEAVAAYKELVRSAPLPPRVKAKLLVERFSLTWVRFPGEWIKEARRA